MKNIKVEWCENFIRAWFAKHAFLGSNAGIEVNCFWKLAEAAEEFMREHIAALNALADFEGQEW